MYLGTIVCTLPDLLPVSDHDSGFGFVWPVVNKHFNMYMHLPPELTWQSAVQGKTIEKHNFFSLQKKYRKKWIFFEENIICGVKYLLLLICYRNVNQVHSQCLALTHSMDSQVSEDMFSTSFILFFFSSPDKKHYGGEYS